MQLDHREGRLMDDDHSQRYPLRAVLVLVLWTIGVPVIGSLAFSILSAPFVWFYGIAVAILMFPYSLLLPIGSAAWLAVRTFLNGGFSALEAMIATVASVTIVFWTLNPDLLLGKNAVPNSTTGAALVGYAFFCFMGAMSAVGTWWLLGRMGVIQARQAT